MRAVTTTARGPLRPFEISAAAVFGALTSVVTVVTGFIPVGVAQVLITLPIAFLAAGNRMRSAIAATVAASVVALIAGGPFAVVTLLVLVGVGMLVGYAERRWGRNAVLVVFAGAVPLGLAVAAFAVGMLLLFEQSRILLLDSLAASMQGTLRAFQAAGAGQEFVDTFTRTIDFLVDYWWLWIGGAAVAGIVGSALLSFGIFRTIALRTRWSSPPIEWPATAAEPAPLPVRLSSVTYRYPGAATDALADIDLTIAAGEFVAVVGANGSGKSTLARVLAGLDPTTGLVDRPGDVGLGAPGGTALVFQHPESQILGRTVAEDVRWGLVDGDIDVDGLLARVGLGGLADRPTEDLSGGQLQRLTLAAALARRPALLIADEITAMVDDASRAALLGLLAGIARDGTAVVLVTHVEGEAATARRVVHLERGRLVPAPAPATRAVSAATPPIVAHPILEIRDVTHTYAARTPWAHTALRDVSLTVGRGEGVLVVGANGSGKSTLAWVLAGLHRPTTGTCTLNGTPTADRRGDIGLVFQQARLQLQRPTVAEEICDVAGLDYIDRPYVAAVLHRVGLGAHLVDRAVDTLSGGEMRRIAVAAQLTRAPRVLVLDEPLAGLDDTGRHDLVALLGYLRAAEHMTIVVISHDLHGMEAVCSRTVVLDGGTIVDDRTVAA
ncbi:ABC transporter ATP-binding protein [Rhodococcus zopfii]|uniref:ABC transporter ATP-binding protein n=1 Tax=Rhodococcus zopfii TaxID=43772 RepID=UPI003529AA08